MKLLILGGTVFLGRYLVEAALARGHQVTTFNRGLHDSGMFPDVEKLHGDRRGDLAALQGRKWDAVVDTCGYVPVAVRASSRALADAVDHYTFISSQSVYADYEKNGIDESYAVQTLTDEQVHEAEMIEPSGRIVAVAYGEKYGGLKARCEATVDEEMPGRTLKIRAGLIVGPNDYTDRFTYWVRRIAEGGEVLAPGNQDQPVQFVDVRDLAEWIVRMAENRQTGTYNATGPDRRMTMLEMLETFRSSLGGDASLTWVGEEFLKEANVKGWTEVPLWLPSEDNIFNFFSVDCRKAIQSDLSFRPLSETARDTLEWNNARSTELRAGLSREREVELLRAWRENQ